MTIDTRIDLRDDAPVADAIEQWQPADPTDDGGLDAERLAALAPGDADPADLVEQVFVVPLPEDERDEDDWAGY
jgi:hypothetical protein